MEFKAEIVKGELIVKPIIERVGNNVTIHVPSFNEMNKKMVEYIANSKTIEVK